MEWKETAAYCLREFPAEAEHIKKTADQICKNYFIFTNKWDLEQAPFPVRFENSVDWGINPNGDPEYLWQFNRHRYFICLGQAYQCTGDEKYAECFVRLLCDWIRRTPLTKEQEDKAWRSLEAGFRGENWTKAMAYFKESPAVTEEVYALYEDSLCAHAAWLLQKQNTGKYISNWGVIENHGLFSIALAMREASLRERYAMAALASLDAASKIQIMGDGMQWEQSPLYHCEAARCYLSVLLLAKRHRILLPEGMEERVHAMLLAMRDFRKPDGHMFLTGDSDDLDMEECFQLGASYFGDETLKQAAGGRLGYEAAWQLGLKGIEAYAGLGCRKPGHISAAFSDSGHFYLRSGWEADANLLHFTCGPIGGGHGHFDMLHVDLVMGGRDVLTDAGRYTYALSHGRKAFKEPQAHNTILADGKPYTECLDSWACRRPARPIGTSFLFGEDYEFVQGGHMGYFEAGIYINRKIIYIRPDIYLIADEMYAQGGHTCETFFHFNEDGAVSITGEQAVYQDSKGAVRLWFLSEAFAEGNASLCKSKSEISRHYNSRKENDCLTVEQRGSGFLSFYTVIAGENVTNCRRLDVSCGQERTPCSPEMAEAVEIRTKDTAYVILVCHREIEPQGSFLEAGGCLGFGNVVVFDKTKETIGGTVLHW